MTTVGVDVREHSATAVAVNAAGAVTARAAVQSRTELAALSIEAVEAVVRAAGGDARIGVTSSHPESPVIGDVVDALNARVPRGLSRDGVLPAAAAAASAECWTGAARGISDIVWFSASDHATAAIVRDGHPVLGAHRRAASIAWLALNPVEREDYRKVGCLEAEVGAAGLVRRLVWRIKAGDKSRVADAVDGDWLAITVEHVLTAARDGDGVSISVVRDTARYLGMAAANLVAVADPQMLVLAGIMATASDLLLDPIRGELMRRLPAAAIDLLTVAPATLGPDAAAIGAARLAAAAR